MNFLNALQRELDGLDPELDEKLAQAEKENTDRAHMETFEKRFEQRFRKGSWLLNNWDRRKSSEYYTYLFHSISGAGAYYAFFLLFGVIVWSWMGALVALVVIFFHEREKRRWSDKFWDSFVSTTTGWNWKALIINVGLFLISMGLTVGGTYFGLKDNMPGAQQVGVSSDPVAMALQEQLKESRAELKAFEENKSNYNSQGQMYYKRIDTWNAMQARVTDTEAQLKDQFGIITIQNTSILNEWMQKRWFVVLMGVLICLLAEIGFEYNMYFRSLYDYRYYRAKKAQLKATPLSYQANGIPVNGNGNVNGQKKSPALS